ncbi:hypothetical protein ACFOM8_01870 [Paracoccus angustae]|uniref:VPLPA-CTERM protein sorting domain-containing protein n=1 Tax=Paracoccus angustae TaxID=1671480 RepID=A0ABV7U005_9RHOB
MGIRSLCAAAVAVVGIGQAAEAATYTTTNYDLTVRYEGTVFDSVLYSSLFGEEDDKYYGYVPAGDTSLGLQSYLFGAPAISTTFRFTVSILDPLVPITEPFYGNGGRTPVCQLGPWDCTRTNRTSLDPYGFFLAWDDDWIISGAPTVGSSIEVFFHAIYGDTEGTFYTTDRSHAYSYSFETSNFTVLSVNDPAPVPLPATAALLPLGLGALAVMRKRRRLS